MDYLKISRPLEGSVDELQICYFDKEVILEQEILRFYITMTTGGDWACRLAQLQRTPMQDAFAVRGRIRPAQKCLDQIHLHAGWIHFSDYPPALPRLGFQNSFPTRGPEHE